MHRLNKILCFLAVICHPIFMAAQFTPGENDAAGLKWFSRQTANFRVIYPAGCDSMALEYLRALEVHRPAIARSIGMTANDFNRRPMPVILHTQNAASNGSVTWPPHRMELITFPEWANTTPLPWHTILTIHEGRHAAQMQNGYHHVFKPFYYLLGGMSPGISAAYPGRLLLEGDAVVAETGLTTSGRGRQANFLNDYMYFFDNGEWRNWMRWRLGSYYRTTPNCYALGYMMISGIRTKYDKPLFMADYFNYVSLRPYDPWPLRHAMRRASGKKFKPTYNEILRHHYETWAADTAARAPFTPTRQLSRPWRHLVNYESPNSAPDGGHLWIKKDIYDVPKLVQIAPDGKEKKLCHIAASAGKINYEESDSTLIWNELRKHPRWGQKNRSVVMRYHIPSGRRSMLTHYDRYIYPIEVSADTVAAIRYDEHGAEFIDFISKKDGRTHDSWRMNDSLQVVEITHIGTNLYGAAISDGGYGIYKLHRHGTDVVLPARPVKITALDHDGNGLIFESDRTGVNEFYRLDLNDGRLWQLSSYKYGALDYGLCPNGDLASSQIGSLGTRACVTEAKELLHREVDWDGYHRYPIADKLSAQEQDLAAGRIESTKFYPRSQTLPTAEADTVISESKRYRKAGHLIHFHSWAPAFVDLDVLNNLSFENIKNLASLGAMGFFQNSMDSFNGWLGYKAAPDNNGHWFHSGHINLTYKGWWPVFEAEAHINESYSLRYNDTNGEVEAILDKPLVRGRLRTYLPLSWNTSCSQFGFTPSIAYNIDNREFRGRPVMSWAVGGNIYAMQNVPKAAIYPRWGIEVEGQWFSPLGYVHVYGYVPGICCGQGLKLGAVYEGRTDDISPLVSQYLNLMPRGYTRSGAVCPIGLKISADYAIPFYMGDWHISELFYCNRGILTPHFDCTFPGKIPSARDNLYSVGATLELEFGCFLWIRTPIRIGVTYSYNGGELSSGALSGSSPHYVGATYSISLPN